MLGKLFGQSKTAAPENAALAALAERNQLTLDRLQEFRADPRPRATKFKEFLTLKHEYPFVGFVPCQAGDIDFTLFHANDDIVAWEYFWFGADAYERDIMDTWLSWSREAETVLDIGGYCGLMSIIAALANPRAKVDLFEPMPRTIERAKINLRANGVLKRVRLHNSALSDQSGRAEIHLPREENFLGTGNSLMQKSEQALDTKLIDCEVADEVLPDIVPDLVKIDVEGHEYACLQGMQAMLGRSQPRMIIEVWQHTRTEVIALLEGLGYTCEPFEKKESNVMNYKCEPPVTEAVDAP